MTEGSLYNVIQYDPNGNWVTSWGTTNAAHSVAFDYPSQCVVNPTSGLVYISNQFGKSIVVLNPSTNAAAFVSPPSPNTFIQPEAWRSMALATSGSPIQGHHRLDIYRPELPGESMAQRLGLQQAHQEVTPPGGVNDHLRHARPGDRHHRSRHRPHAHRGAVDVRDQRPELPRAGVQRRPDQQLRERCLPHQLQQRRPCRRQRLRHTWVLAGNGQFEDGARGIAIDGNHDVWAGDLGDFRTQVFDENGNWLNNVPGYWPGDNGGTSPPSVPAGGGFNGPRGVAFDSGGNMYVTDMYNERIQEFSPTSNGWTLNTTLNAARSPPAPGACAVTGPVR